MLTRVTKVLVGKDIARTASLVIGGAGDNLAEGEVFVTDDKFNLLAAGATISDTDTIYIGTGLGTTYDYANEAGTAVTAVRRILYSQPIEGRLVKGWYTEAYSAKTEKVVTLSAITGTPAAIAVGEEFILRLIFKDIPEHPGQFTKTYRATAATTGSEDLFDLLRTEINTDKDSRVVGSGTTTLILTGKPIPECTTALTDIDKFRMVDWETVFNYVDGNANWQTVVMSSATVVTTIATEGNGEWEQIRDLEKATLGYRGVSNQTQFPVKAPSFMTVLNETYDLLVIEHDKSYVAPDNQYTKATPTSTLLALADGASQTADILAVLNPWMASLPGAFANVSF